MKKIIIALFTVGISIGISNGQSNIRTKHFNLENGIGIQGYDPVAYFKENKAVKGKKEFAVNAEGVIYYFSSAENKNLFQKDNMKYEPQYGGWCAYAMGAVNEKVAIDPETFKISDGKLYLFYHTWINNTLTKWNSDETNLKTKANKNWQDLFH